MNKAGHYRSYCNCGTLLFSWTPEMNTMYSTLADSEMSTPEELRVNRFYCLDMKKLDREWKECAMFPFEGFLLRVEVVPDEMNGLLYVSGQFGLVCFMLLPNFEIIIIRAIFVCPMSMISRRASGDCTNHLSQFTCPRIQALVCLFLSRKNRKRMERRRRKNGSGERGLLSTRMEQVKATSGGLEHQVFKSFTTNEKKNVFLFQSQRIVRASKK